jgi:hypothetical protein
MRLTFAGVEHDCIFAAIRFLYPLHMISLGLGYTNLPEKISALKRRKLKVRGWVTLTRAKPMADMPVQILDPSKANPTIFETSLTSAKR